MSNMNVLTDGSQIATLAIVSGATSEQVNGFDIYSDEGNIRVGNTVYMEVTRATGTLSFNLVSSSASDLGTDTTVIYSVPNITAGTDKVTLAFPVPDSLSQQYFGIQFAGSTGTGTVNAIYWDQK